MKHWIALGLVSLAVATVAAAEQNPAQPPAPPQVAVNPQGPPRTDGRHHGMRAFEFRMNGPEDSARILPPGPWWKDQDLAKRIELTPDQQKRIEDTFLQSKIELIHLHASLEEQEVMLAPMLDANPIDQGRVLAQISKIADTRASLEKANAKMLLQIRGVLNQQQWTRLQQERPSMRQHMFMRMPDGPHSWNVIAPDVQSLRERLHASPAMDSDQLQAQSDAALQSRATVDPQRLKVQIDAAMLDLPRVNTQRLGALLLQLDGLPEVLPQPAP